MDPEDMKELKELIDENNPTIEIVKEKVEEKENNPNPNDPGFKMPTFVGRPGRPGRPLNIVLSIGTDETVDNTNTQRTICTLS